MNLECLAPTFNLNGYMPYSQYKPTFLSAIGAAVKMTTCLLYTAAQLEANVGCLRRNSFQHTVMNRSTVSALIFASWYKACVFIKV